MCWHVLVRGRSCRNFHRRVAASVRLFFTPFFRSDDEDPDGGVNCSIRCRKGRVFETVGTAARGGAWSFFAGALTGAWRRVQSPMMVIFLGFDRSCDALSNGSPHSNRNSLYRFPQTASIVMSKNSGSKGIQLEGDAFLREGLQLTTDTYSGDNTNSAGRASHNESVRLWDNSTGRLTDFITHFSFKIQARDPNYAGDGLSFLIVPFDSQIPKPLFGGTLGMVRNGDHLNETKNQFVAVEFDTFYNSGWDPISDDHVGIDVNSIKSKNAIAWPTSIKNGSTANAWVTYNSTTYNLSVFLTFADKPDFSGNYNLSYNVDLRTVLPERVRVGFSASTGAAFETHTILFWSFNSTLVVKDDEPTSPNKTVDSTTPPNNSEDGNGKNKLGLAIGLSVSSGVVSCALGLLWFICWRKRASANTEDFEDDDDMDDEFEQGTGPKRFTYYELLRATNNFAEGGMLGEGGFGGVYKGLLSESNIEVAVKRVSKGSKQGKKEYISEVKIISRLRHRNLVQLIGWCHDQRELLLVYEYMPNGSLDSHLFGGKITLTWPVRYKIAHGLASALLYLHEEWEQCVVHRDIKSSNIMLDSNFNTKLGDFGLARLVEHELGSQTTVLAGTMGYLAPECFTTGKASKESDVYSFGVVSLEIACGRKPIEAQSEPSKVRLVEWVWDLYGKGQLFEAVDKGLSMEFDEGQMECLMVVGLWCCHPDPTNRPSIRQVLHVLNFEAPFPNLPSKLPVPMYFQPPMHMCKFSNTSSGLTSSKDQTPCSCSSCSTNSSMSAGPSKPLLHSGKTDVELASIIH
uniref:non-specific serine/threonine protein kinase n=1 Tax=Fagus sylvatica TaxID=28930 RepID=A0A2N9GIG3_FAGSY